MTAKKDATPAPKYWLIKTNNRRTRRRAGHLFGPQATKLDLSTLTKKAQAAIQSDPVLDVKGTDE